jgi:hypothetical protein
MAYKKEISGGKGEISGNKADISACFASPRAYYGNYCPGINGDVRKKEVTKMRNNKKGMEMVQVAILVAIAIGLGILFKDNITSFIEDTFTSLTQTRF